MKSVLAKVCNLQSSTCLSSPRVLGLYINGLFYSDYKLRFRYVVSGYFTLIAIPYKLLSALGKRNKLGCIVCLELFDQIDYGGLIQSQLLLSSYFLKNNLLVKMLNYKFFFSIFSLFF